MEEPEDELVGKILLGKLEVLRRLGGGGMGVVYEVEHRLTGHRRALKVVQARYADRPRFMKRLLREAKVAGTLDTPYVVETFDAGRLEDGSAYVLMELLRGQTLYEAVTDENRLAPRRVASIMAQVAEGMAVAHAAGIVHRDLKPENIFLITDAEGEERVKILDFGVSKFDSVGGEEPTRLTAEGTLVGTPYYMSPEQAGGKNIDARTDVYAMGVMLYEALTGRLPFEADSVGELFIKIGAGECVPLRIRRPDIDDRWHDVVHRAFERDADRRFQDVESLRRELVPLASNVTAARARTISDGAGSPAVRGTLGYEDKPRKPKHSQDALTLAGTESEPPPESNEDVDIEEGQAASAPPSSSPALTRKGARGLPGWAWAAIGAVAVLALLIPLQMSSDDDAPAANAAPTAPTTPNPTELAPDERAAAIPDPTPGEELEALAAPIDAGVAPATVVPGRRGSPATSAGLDPNPYR